jgi:hypothetical protein
MQAEERRDRIKKLVDAYHTELSEKEEIELIQLLETEIKEETFLKMWDTLKDSSLTVKQAREVIRDLECELLHYSDGMTL